MQIYIIWLGIGVLALSACVGSEIEGNERDTSQTFQTVTAPVQSTSSALSPVSALPTPSNVTQPAPPTLLSPLPSPTASINQTATNVVAVQTPTKSPQLSNEAALIYQRSGGIAGISETWAVYTDGRVVAGNGRESRLTPEQIEPLLNRIEALGFFALKDNYMPKNSCCDQFTYELTLQRGDKVHTITTLGAGPGMPAELATILTEVRNFFANLP